MLKIDNIPNSTRLFIEYLCHNLYFIFYEAVVVPNKIPATAAAAPIRNGII